MRAQAETTPMAERRRPLMWPALAASLILVYAAAGIGGAATRPNIEGWYRALEKPAFTPPDWAFGPAWGILYTIMAVVLWQIFRTPAASRAEGALRRRALIAFVVQLVFNVGWSVAFFGLRSPAAGMVVVVAMWAAIVWTMAAARPVIGGWAFALLPYLGWVTFAGVLNAAILALNG